MANTYKTGKAYGFFDCKAPIEDVLKELSDIRVSKPIPTPSALELSLTEGIENLNGDLGLIGIASEAKDAGLTYVLEATYPNATNEQTTYEISSIFQQMSQTQLDDGSNRYGVVYDNNDDYVFRR